MASQGRLTPGRRLDGSLYATCAAGDLARTGLGLTRRAPPTTSGRLGVVAVEDVPRRIQRTDLLVQLAQSVLDRVNDVFDACHVVIVRIPAASTPASTRPVAEPSMRRGDDGRRCDRPALTGVTR
jgi:hypothetical protein